MSVLEQIPAYAFFGDIGVVLIIEGNSYEFSTTAKIMSIKGILLTSQSIEKIAMEGDLFPVFWAKEIIKKFGEPNEKYTGKFPFKKDGKQ